MHVWNVLHAARWKYRMQKWHKKLPSAHHRTTLLGYTFATEACIDNQRKKLVKQQYLLHMSLQYGELCPTHGWDLLASLWHPIKFQQVSRFGFVTAPTSLSGGQPKFKRCLDVYWAGTLYIHLWGLLPLAEFCQVQNSLYVQVLYSPILAALLHCTRAVGISQSLRHGARNGITELSLLVIFNWGRHLYSEGGHHVGHKPTF